MAGFECLEDIILGARGVRRRRGTRRKRREKEIEACAGGGEGRGERRRERLELFRANRRPLSFPIVPPIFQFE